MLTNSAASACALYMPPTYTEAIAWIAIAGFSLLVIHLAARASRRDQR